MVKIDFSGSFFTNYLNFFLILLAVLLLNFMVKWCLSVSTHERRLKKKSLWIKAKLAVHTYLRYDVYARYFLEGFLFMNVTALLEIKTISFTKTNWATVLSNLAAIFAFAFNTFILIFILGHFCKYRKTKKLDDQYTKFRVFYEGIKET